MLLNMLGNETRREILQLLAKKPCYVSELSQELKVGQKAIIEHLEQLKEAGLLEVRTEKVEKGRPRKYFEISKDIILEVKISTEAFEVKAFELELSGDIFDRYPWLRALYERAERIMNIEDYRYKALMLNEIYKEIREKIDEINKLKRALEYLLKEVRCEIKKDTVF